ncbi:PREDICTED: uncharacterized protein LOC108379202 [Rhagoletis zephyria]|uniref:uncharacterized protein LOC108379202 n=1 Tax=Rhagoletis zephyria TaxID=28612 RepID=UPI0008115E50|nr:PREDICTED: uncharacterized protein LOC108379202 [Rhagoletis zephyria]
MATVNANPISTSCQSIASAGGPSGGSLGTVVIGGATTGQRSTTHYVNGTGSLGRLKYHHKHKSLDASDEELDYSQLSQSTHIIGRVRSERFLASKPDEDRRRRTIIIEKKNDSYGFTLQSYGIHYKKDQEVEMITYVDYVEYDGPAYKSGMREGDVILSINGTDMEKADHKTIVDFIKSCDTRMRMVVLFEDCVRKVDLHMRYIQLQNLLHSKMNELERICLRERELLEGKWKTHSLPARKKATTSPTDAESGISPTDGDTQNLPYYRPALSTEDVPSMARHQAQQPIIPPPAQFMLTYHYLDPTYRYVMKPSTSNSSGEYIVGSTSGADGIKRSPSEQHFILRHTESLDTATGMASLSQRSVLSQQRSAASSQAPVPPPRTCEKHKPPTKQHSLDQQAYQQQHQQQQQQQSKIASNAQKMHKSAKHCYGHSCNPCIGHFRWKSAEKAAAMGAAGAVIATSASGGNGNGDNVSLDAYDLASPCCDAHCVPTRRRTRHKEHTHKHKHRDRERDSKDRQPRPKSQTSHASPGTTRHHTHHHHHHTAQEMLQQQQQQQPQPQQPHHHHHHLSPQQQHQLQQQQQQQHGGCDSHNGSIRSRYFDLTTGLMSHCSLHSCTSSEFAPADSNSYTTSLSTDTLYWDPKSEHAASRQPSTKSRQSYQQHAQQSQQQQQSHQQQQPSAHVHGIYQQRYHITATQVQPSQIYPQATYVQKPKSWDNLTTKAVGGYGFGYGYLDTVSVKPTVKLQIAQQRHSIPRKNPYGRYSTYTDVENYAPPPSQFVEELITTTTTTKIMAKSTEELIAAPMPQTPCDCMTKQQQQALKAAQYQVNQAAKVSHHNSCQMGYYSHLPRPTLDAGTSTVQTTTTTGSSGDVATVSEVTRL